MRTAMLLMILIVFLLVPGEAWLAGWQYRREITITERSGNTLTYYQVLIELNSTNFDSWSSLNSDCSDLRITDTGDNLLPLWNETCDITGQEVKIWTKVNLTASNTTTIYLYYGNPSAVSVSNVSAVFDYYTNFCTDDGMWTETSSTGLFTIDTTNCYMQIGGSSTTTVRLNKVFDPYNPGYEAEYSVLFDTTSTANNHNIIGTFLRPSTWAYGVTAPQAEVMSKVHVNPAYDYAIIKAPSYTYGTNNLVAISSFNDGNWHKIIFRHTGDYVNSTVEGIAISVLHNSTFANDIKADTNDYWFFFVAEVGAVKIGYVRIRKYVDPEPSVSVGAEETNSNPITVHILNPLENEAFDISSVNVNYITSSTVEVESCSYSLDGQANISLQNCENFTLTNLTEGIHNLTIWAWNSTGGIYSKDSVSFKVDLTPPTIIFFSPGNEETERTVYVNFTATDNVTSVTGCGYKIDNGDWSNLPGCMNFSYILSEAGWHTIWINATDEVGHTAVESKAVLINPVQTIWFKDADSGAIIQEYTLYLWNATNFTLVRSTTTGNVSWKLFEGPLRITYVKPYAIGYNATVFMINITTTADINQTFSLEPASLTVNCFDEQRLQRIPCKVTVTNTSVSTVFGGANWVLYDDFTGSGTYPDSNKWAVERCDGFGSGYCVRLSSNQLYVYYSYAAASECDWSAVYSKESSYIWEFDVSSCSITGVGYGGIYLRDSTGNTKEIYSNCKNGHWKIYIRDKVAYIYVDGTLEASVDVSSLSDYYIRFLSGQCRDDSGATTKATTFYVDNLDIGGSFYKLWNEIPNGELTLTISPDTENEFYLTDYVTRTYYTYVDKYTTMLVNTYLLQSSQALTQQFLVQDISGKPVSGATITVRRFINNTWVTIAQAKTDSSGYAQIPLDPTVTYQLYVSSTEGTAEGTLIPSPNLKTITIYQIQEPEKTGVLGITYSLEIENLTSGRTAKVTYTVNADTNDLEYFYLNITNTTGNVFYKKVAGSPSGGTISTSFSVSDKKYTIIYGFKKAGFNEYAWLKTVLVGIKYEAVNGTIPQVLEESTASPFAKAVTAMIGVILAAMIHPLFALLTLWYFGLANWIPLWIPTIISVLTAVLLLGGVG